MYHRVPCTQGACQGEKVLSNILPDFQKFLAERKLVPAGNILFYTLWVSKFL